ncbi:M48 family metallopeptidase [Roseitranquillus sediminis]|uniref:M48 family metallopeptidase n=1 Tax=Roseitranquillus sediminis TaxID=2809051 RepID=UPI001D0C6553|nr:M48 family metallopeptidase [Roseitranquillus sediminis]MBM9595728.1 M48 family metallopeptidase [Roseitranquillus sediminis]
MCIGHGLSRRRFLAGAGALSLAGGCDGGFPIDLVSDDRIEAMGLEAWQQMHTGTRRSDDADLQRALDTVAGRLLTAAGERTDAWEAVVFEGPEINAFALPGNKIGVFEGLFGVVGNLDQLAAVVGHEIGHLQAEHGHERVNTQVAKDLGLRVIAFLLQQGDVQFAAEIAAALGLGVEFGLVLPYSRNQELEADRLGLQIMASGGYDPAQAVDLWRRMEAAGGPRAPAFLATHPAPAQRIEAIEAMLPEIRAG